MQVIKPEVEKAAWERTGIIVIFRLFALFIFLASAALSETSARSRVDLIYELGVARLETAEYILRATADFLSEHPDASERQGHIALKGILNESEQFTSILALDENGILMFDSFNWIPFLGGADLGARDYFRETTNAASKELVLGSPVVGKQSGEWFIPITMAVPNATGRNQRVAVLRTPVETLLPLATLCPYCGTALMVNRKVVASSRPMSEVNEAIASRLQFDGRYGASEVVVRGMSVGVHWRKSPSTGVLFIYYEARQAGGE
ncbi:hypothetical protein Q4525_18980 [Shimia thalassica]|uniref:PDC sensor domain-containing protein n=1 Tax=Shimia thalassica TaxID=1715693 RepID=UPI001C088158|nr:hypothetical protein [Shimia thalassica]MBU2942696.1 hypothetical protein [Shimia thalassica]MDO6485812.1 hypothetical protein [Shimia thalassica]MDO6505027.1 hypothetical protein [Shimia thalassica]